MDYENYKLFSRPTFLEGMARALDIGCNLDDYNYSEDAETADCEAIKSDFEAIGKDLKKAINNVSEA